MAEWGVGAGLAGGTAGLGTVKEARLALSGLLPDAPWETDPQQRWVREGRRTAHDRWEGDCGEEKRRLT